jgi:hypothetical protein
MKKLSTTKLGIFKLVSLTSPRKIAERRTEKKGSMALIVCVNETATLPKLRFVKRFPIVCTKANGRIATSWNYKLRVTWGLVQPLHLVLRFEKQEKLNFVPEKLKS